MNRTAGYGEPAPGIAAREMQSQPTRDPNMQYYYISRFAPFCESRTDHVARGALLFDKQGTHGWPRVTCFAFFLLDTLAEVGPLPPTRLPPRFAP